MKKDKEFICKIFILSIIFLITIYKCFFEFKIQLFFGPGDAETYYNLAIKMYEKNIFQEDFPISNEFRSWRTPGYPFFLYLLRYINILNSTAAFYFNIFFLITSFLFVFLIIKKFIINETNCILILIYSIVTHIDGLAYLAQRGVNECLYLFFLTFSIYLILVKKKFLQTLGFLILGLAVLIRTTILPLMILLLLCAVVKSFYLKKNLIKFKYLLAFLPAILWMVRNYFIFNEFGFFIGSNSDHLLLGTYKKIDWEYIDGLYNNAKSSVMPFEILRAKMRFDEGIARIFNSPINYVFLKLEVILRHLLTNFAIIPLLLVTKLIIENNKKIFGIIKANQKLYTMLIICLLFMCINSITHFVPRYGIIASFLLSNFLLITLSKLLINKN